MVQSPAEPELNPAQSDVVRRGLLTSGFSLILQMPTGSGKTWLAEQAIAATLARGQRAIYLTPLRALANELVGRWNSRFAGHKVGVFTGDYGQRQAYPVPFEQARLLIMTPERLDACTRHWRSHWGWLPEVGLLVVDELHLIGDRSRGPRLEGALMRARRLNPFLQLLGLSATLGNRAELADWLGGVHFGSSWQPIPIEWRAVRYQRATDKPRILQQEVQRCTAGGGQSLVFVQSRRRAEALSAELRTAGVPADHHHAGLDSAERQRIEGDYRAGQLRALVSTGTLEMGLNLPARQVVLYDLQSFDGTDFVPLSVNTVWQRAGRAGRRGLDTKGEVVLIAPTWDRLSERYAAGKFERVASGLCEARALAEQVLAEVSSGLARTREQLARNLQQSLAAHQQTLPSLNTVVGDMLDSGMLIEVTEQEARGPALRATRLGRIAVRQMLSPATVLSLSQALEQEAAGQLTFLDLLMLCAQTGDCQPLIPMDFEELEELGECLAKEKSTLLCEGHQKIRERLGITGRRLLAVIKTTLVARAWTRMGCANLVADAFGCYSFEVRRLSESLERILTAATAIVSPPPDEDSTPDAPPANEPPEEGGAPTVRERVLALQAMVAHGVDEEVVTLTYIDGIGGTLARRLREAGIKDIEELAQADVSDLSPVRGISSTRAERWISEAGEMIKTRSAFALREAGPGTETATNALGSATDPYRLRRALDLQVRRHGRSFTVTGGLEPHRVKRQNEGLGCDCADFAKGHSCKHILAVRLHCKDAELTQFVERISTQRSVGQLDLLQLWFDGDHR